MKNVYLLPRLPWVVTSLLALSSSLASTQFGGAADLESPRILSISANDDSVTLTWTNGRPVYQLQVLTDLNGQWENIGKLVSETSATVPLPGPEAFFRVVADYTARYEVVFAATWSPQTHPGAYPDGAHWSPLIGGTHNADTHFWRVDEQATEGIRRMAETGQTSQLASEVNTAIGAGHADFVILGPGADSPDTVRQTFPKPVSRDFPLVTLTTMIAPSPDWFAGVDSLSLIEDGQWVNEKTVTLYGHDAGTDSGTDFRSTNQATTPRAVVTRMTGYPALIDDEIVPFGTFTFRRLDP